MITDKQWDELVIAARQNAHNILDEVSCLTRYAAEQYMKAHRSKKHRINAVTRGFLNTAVLHMENRGYIKRCLRS